MVVKYFKKFHKFMKFSRLQKNSFSSQLRKIINKSRLSKDEKEFLIKGSGLSLINYEEE